MTTGIAGPAKGKEWIIDGAFIATHPTTILAIGKEAEGSFSRNHVLVTGACVPRLVRRQRLQRFSRIAADVCSVRMFWRWLRG